MKKIFQVIKCEFIKNYTLKNILLIFIVFIISAIGATELTYITTKRDPYNLEQEIDYWKEEYARILQDKDSLKKDFELDHRQREINGYEYLQTLKNNIHQQSWQLNMMKDILYLEDEIFVINQMLENPDSNFSTDGVMQNGVAMSEMGSYEGTIYHVKEKSTKGLETLKQELEEKVTIRKKLLEENLYYKYIEFRILNYEEKGYDDTGYLDNIISDGNIEIYRKMVADKIEDENDVRVLRLFQLGKLYGEDTISTKQEYKTTEYDYFKWSYNGYLRYTKSGNELIRKYENIITYSIEHNLNHDLDYDKKVGLDVGDVYMTSKLAVNQVLHLSIVVMLLVALTSAGIISKEHSKGTVKSLFTSPINRGKVFISKFIYLILHTYILWFVALFFLFIYAGFRFGFTDLFTPKLVYYGSKVQEVNYLFWIIKEIIINSIPVLAMVSILYMLSTITLNTSLTVSVSTLLAILSPAMWFLISKLKLVFLVYTPFPYFDITIMKNKSEYYLNTLAIVPTNQLLGYIICFITIIICYYISYKFYLKSDITNGGE